MSSLMESWFDFFLRTGIIFSRLFIPVNVNDALCLPHLNEQHHSFTPSSLRIRQATCVFLDVLCDVDSYSQSFRPLYFSYIR